MLKSTKNELLKLIADGFDVARFEREEQVLEGGTLFIIRLKGTPLEFRVRTASDNHHAYKYSFVQFTPDYRYVRVWSDVPWSFDFSDVLTELELWLNQHVAPYLEEENLEDLWNLVDNPKWVLGADQAGPAELARFTTEEKSATREAIAEFERRIHATFLPNPEQAAAISSQLKYLSDAVDRLNHFDWRSLLLSTVIGISTTLSLDTETGRQLFEIAKHIFAGALKYLPG